MMDEMPRGCGPSILFSLLVTGCSSFGASPPPADGGTDGGAATPNGLISNFDAPSDACVGGWSGDRSNLSRIEPGHDSPGACRACNSPLGAGLDYDAQYMLAPDFPTGVEWELALWIRAPQSPACLRLGDGNSSTELGSPVDSSDWQHVIVTFTIPTSGPHYILVHAQAASADTECFDFDEVTLQRR
jgi:hypothetical protein